MRHNLTVVAAILAGFAGLALSANAVVSLAATDKAEWDRGWQAGFAARDAQTQDANSRLIASGICRYADLACAGGKR
jgi:hypothetical protein